MQGGVLGRQRRLERLEGGHAAGPSPSSTVRCWVREAAMLASARAKSPLWAAPVASRRVPPGGSRRGVPAPARRVGRPGTAGCRPRPAPPRRPRRGPRGGSRARPPAAAGRTPAAGVAPRPPRPARRCRRGRRGPCRAARRRRPARARSGAPGAGSSAGGSRVQPASSPEPASVPARVAPTAVRRETGRARTDTPGTLSAAGGPSGCSRYRGSEGQQHKEVAHS